MLLAMPTRHRYLLLRRLGRTGHSTVYGAVDQLLAREVALKLHHDDHGDDGEWRVLGEARTMSLVEHPNIVRVFDVGVHEGVLYSVTELCDTDMATWAKGRAWGDVIERILEAGRGLAALHAADFVHGDVKPGNLLVRGGVAKVADFGMATRPGLTTRIGGTAGYIAPEVPGGLRTAAADVFALAAAAWACLFGRSAFGVPPQTADRLAAIVLLIERASANEIEPPPPTSEVPARVVSVLRRGLAPHPVDRPSLDHWLAQLAACRPWAIRWREIEAPRASSVALLGGVLVMLGAGGHAAYTAFTAVDAVAEVEPSPPPPPEPDVDVHAEMIAAAENDDPFAVWALYWTAEHVGFDAEQLITVATILLLDAESGAASNPAASAEIAKRLGTHAWRRAMQAKSPTSAGQANELVERSQTIINQSN